MAKKLHASNVITTIVNFIIAVVTIPLILVGFWLDNQQLCANGENHILILLLGIPLFLISMLGFRSSFFNNDKHLFWYLCFKVILLAPFFFLLVIFTAGTVPDGSYVVPGKGYKEYKLDGYSDMIRKYYDVDREWDESIKSCVAESKVCSELKKHINSAEQFSLADLTPLQSGCCKPPTVCGYTYVNATTWVNSTNLNSDPDCNRWSNNQTQLCYNCDSCKAGFAGTARDKMVKVNVIMLVILVVLSCILVMGWVALLNLNPKLEGSVC